MHYIVALVERSVVFVTSDTVEAVLRGQRWDRTAWNLANLYLGSVGALLLGPEAVPLLGLSEETTCGWTSARSRTSCATPPPVARGGR